MNTPIWKNDKNWLVLAAVVGFDDEPDQGETLDWLGRMTAFAFITDTRLLVQSGYKDKSRPNPEGAYVLWFSFLNDNEKRRFLNLVRHDAYCEVDDPETGFSIPDLTELETADPQPIGLALPRHQADYVLATSQDVVLKLIASGIANPFTQHEQ